MKQDITLADIKKVAAVDCVASSLMTGLHLAGRDDSFYLLGHWNLTYYSNTIIPENNMADNNLEYAYGIEMKVQTGAIDDMISYLQGEDWVLLVCRASKLPFFPEEMLGLEAYSFLHTILIYGYTPETNAFRVIDPIAEFIGEMSGEQLRDAAFNEGEIRFCSCVSSRTNDLPAAKDIFLNKAKENLTKFTESEGDDGIKAIRLFKQDVAVSARMNIEDRNAWMDRNIITISSIVKTRSLVWDRYCSLGLMISEDVQKGNDALDEIVKCWTTVNFLFVKLKRNPSNSRITDSIQEQLETVERLEYEFLTFLYNKGCELANEELSKC